MQYKKHIIIDLVLKTLVFVFILHIFLFGVCRCMYGHINLFSNLFYVFLLIAYICLLISLFRRKLNIFLALDMLLLALYELHYIFEEYAQGDRFIHIVYMGSYIFLFLFIIVLKAVKDKERVLSRKWLLPFGLVFGIIIVLYRIRFLGQAGAALTENPHNIVIGEFQMDCAHLVEELFIILLAGWIFLFHSRQKAEDIKINSLDMLEIMPAVLFFITALDIAYTMLEIFVLRMYYNDFSFNAMEYFLRLFFYFVMFLSMGIALIKKKKKLLSITSLLLFIMYVIWKDIDYNGVEYYIYMSGYLAIFILNIVMWIDKKENFRYKLYILIPCIFLFMMGAFKMDQWIMVSEDFKNNYVMWKGLVNIFAIFFTMLWVVYPRELLKGRDTT